MPQYSTKEYDVVIIGAGGAGLRAAIEAGQDKSVKVAMICKSLLGKAHTVMAEGGVAAALRNVDIQDNWKVHFRDTMKGGKFLNNWRMAEIHAKESPERVLELEKWGAVFDRTKKGDINQRPFGGHTYARLAHVGDRTGLEMLRTLQDHAVHQDIEVFMEHTVIELFIRENQIIGLLCYSRASGKFIVFSAKAVILATGGCARCFEVQTNSWETTGDGHALAYHAGAELIDMEFLQFHPTGMVWPPSVKGILVTEGVRGEGGILKNSKGERFMFRYIPPAFKNDVAETEKEANRWVRGDRKHNRKPPELLTRDVVAKAILAEVKAGRGSVRGGAYLDIASVRTPEYIKKKLPSMYHQFKNLADVDITKDPMEIGPTAHYIMGGVRVNPESAESSVEGLFACGEVSGGLHGANRLGGNSLSDLLVFGKRAGECALKRAKSIFEFPVIAEEDVRSAIDWGRKPFSVARGENPYALQKELKEIMSKYCGIIRNGEDIQNGIQAIMEIAKRAEFLEAPAGDVMNVAWHTCLDLYSLVTVSELLARAALERKESRGAHTRADYPNYDSALGLQNIVLKKGSEGMEVTRVSIPPLSEYLANVMKEE